MWGKINGIRDTICQHLGMNLRQKCLSPEQHSLEINFFLRTFSFLVILILDTTQWLNGCTHTENSFSPALWGQVIFYHLFPPSHIPCIPLRGVAESLHYKRSGFYLAFGFPTSSSRGSSLPREWKSGFQRDIQPFGNSQGVAPLKEATRKWNSYPDPFAQFSSAKRTAKI